MEIVVGILAIAAPWFIFGKSTPDPRQVEAAKFRETYQAWEPYVSGFNGSALGVSREQGRIVIGTLASYIERDLSTLSSVSIEKDGQGLTVTNRGSQAMGAAVGGVLLGPMGFLVGGLSGSKSHKERVNQLALKVVIDDPDMPVHRLVFFQIDGPGVEARDGRVVAVAERMEHYYAVLSNAIKSQARHDKVPETASVDEPAPNAVEDRLEKLWSLKNAGAISADEFDRQKARLLG